ncbi:hypothetical protein, partial [Streptococcus pneumoniae]|uniref:hypothetical protein n=1 Tax=Streptococcus pneumoniae TaxID=1313 RepID=UPI00016C33FD
TMYESPVGFRHGPKSLINDNTVVLVFGTTPDYKFDDADAWKELTLSDNWTNEEFDLSSLAGKTIYAVKLFFEH